MAWHNFLNPLMNPLLDLGPFLAILVLAVVISLLIVLVYKFFTDQEKMKEMKKKQKDYQKKMKELRDRPEEMMKVQKEAMKINMEYMKNSFKPTLITMIPILLIFGWMAAHLSYEPIYPGETYSLSATFNEGVAGEVTLLVDEGTELLSEEKQEVNSKDVERESKGFFKMLSRKKDKVSGNVWTLKSSEGTHDLFVKLDDGEEQKKEVLITTKLEYLNPVETYEFSHKIKDIQIDHKKLKPLGPDFSILGWKPGWLGLYIIFSLVFSMGLRKLLKIY